MTPDFMVWDRAEVAHIAHPYKVVTLCGKRLGMHGRMVATVWGRPLCVRCKARADRAAAKWARLAEGKP